MRISDWSSDVCSSDLQAPAGPKSMMLGCHEKSCERQRFHTTVTSVLRSAAVLASLNTRSLLRLNHHQESSFSNSTPARSEEHTSELQSLMRISYAVFCLKKKK